jgi:hypothetical protein
MALEGDVRTFPLADLFAWLTTRRASGVLSLTRGMTTRRFHLSRGQVRLVSSSEQDMLLGQLLIEHKLLDATTLASTLAGRGRSRARLGRLLTRGGLVTPRQLQTILTEKVRRLLADALTWSEGRFFYEPSPDAATEAVAAAEAVVTPGARPRRARADSRWGIAVAVDLAAALEQIRGETRAAPADDCVAVGDDDVIEALPAVPAAS